MGGKDWKISKLDSKDSPFAEALDINNRGEIVGDVYTSDYSAALPSLWSVHPCQNSRKLTLLTTLSGSPQGYDVAYGINDLGDIVGASNDADENWLATGWSSKRPNFAQVLGFPANWSVAKKVNNFRIAVGGYGIGDNPEQAAAVPLSCEVQD